MLSRGVCSCVFLLEVFSDVLLLLFMYHLYELFTQKEFMFILFATFYSSYALMHPHLQMPNSTNEFGKHIVDKVREDSERVRLVVSNEPLAAETENLRTQEESTLIWWIRALALCIVALILGLIFVKWGVPFLFEKVIPVNFSSFSLTLPKIL